MSDRLAISATMSVLMMAVYVLFGTDSARVPLPGETLESPLSISVPHVSLKASDVFSLR
jgi:hypothetical protein